LGLVSEKKKKNKDALLYYRRAFKLDPSLWIAFERICHLDVSSGLGLSDLFACKVKRKTKEEVFLNKKFGNIRNLGAVHTPKKMFIGNLDSKERREGLVHRKRDTKRVKLVYEAGVDSRKKKMEELFRMGSGRNKMKKRNLNMDANRFGKFEEIGSGKFNLTSKAMPTLISKRNSPDKSLSISRCLSKSKERGFMEHGVGRKPSFSGNSTLGQLENQKNSEILKRYLMKLGYAYRLMRLGKFNESVNMFNSLSKPLLTLHFVLVNTAICYMHLVRYKNAEKLFAYAFEKEPYESYGLDYYR
jgi:tetratricopeptide (TPR) repeat protein